MTLHWCYTYFCVDKCQNSFLIASRFFHIFQLHASGLHFQQEQHLIEKEPFDKAIQRKKEENLVYEESTRHSTPGDAAWFSALSSIGIIDQPFPMAISKL